MAPHFLRVSVPIRGDGNKCTVCNTLVGECQDQPGTAGREQGPPEVAAARAKEAATVGAMLEQILKGQEVLQVAFWEEHPKEVLH